MMDDKFSANETWKYTNELISWRELSHGEQYVEKTSDRQKVILDLPAAAEYSNTQKMMMIIFLQVKLENTLAKYATLQNLLKELSNGV